MKAIIQHINRSVRVDQVRIAENALVKSYLNADVAAASTTPTVKDIEGFAVGKYVWINPFGVNSEIVAVHASTAPTGNTVTLASGLTFAHTAGEEVLYIEFNQIEISHADTIGGVKSVLDTVDIIARDKEFRYLDITETSGFYLARFKDSVGTTYGEYSDHVAYDGWATNTVGYIIESGMRELGASFSEKVTMRDCIRWINHGLREIKGKVRRWAEHFVYNHITDQTERGINIFTLPSDIYDSETDRSIEAVRVGVDAGLIYLSPGSFDVQMDEAKVTDCRTEAVATDTTLELDNSYDFDDSGSVSFYIAGVKYTLTYTSVTRDDATGGTAKLNGIPASGDGAVTVTIPVDTKIWQGEQEGMPHYFTVRNGQGELWPLPDADHDNQNIYIDYNTEAEVVDSEIDTIDYLRYDMISNYLTWRIECKVENDGKLDMKSGFYFKYKELLNDAIRTMRPNKVKSAPNINRMNRRGGRGAKPDPRLLSNDQQ